MLGNVIELVRGEAKVLPHHEQQVNVMMRGRLSNTFEKELPLEMLAVERASVVVNNRIGLVKKFPRLGDHLGVAIVEVRVEVDLLLVKPLGGESDHAPGEFDLIDVDGRVPKLPRPPKVR